MELKVAAPKEKREVVVNVDIPENLNDLIAKYGEETIADCAVRSLRIAAQGFLRPMLESGSTDEEVINAASTWMPGSKRDTFTSLIQAAKGLSPEKRAALLAQLGM